MKRVMLVSTAFFLLASLSQTQALAEKIYWTAPGTIQRANLDGSELQDLLGPPGGYISVALDLEAEKMYWADGAAGIIGRTNLDGTAKEVLLAELSLPAGISLDKGSGKMYWSTTGADDGIRRANLDGTRVEDVVAGCYLWGPRSTALDTRNRKIYWVGRTVSGPAVRRASLDGTGVEDLVTGLEKPGCIALDVEGGKMYWREITHPGEPVKIQRANLDGTRVEDVLTGLAHPMGIALDADAGKIYWAECDAGTMCRANLDGTEHELLFGGLDRPGVIALDLRFIPEPSTIPLLCTAGVTLVCLLARTRKRQGRECVDCA